MKFSYTDLEKAIQSVITSYEPETEEQVSDWSSGQIFSFLRNDGINSKDNKLILSLHGFQVHTLVDYGGEGYGNDYYSVIALIPAELKQEFDALNSNIVDICTFVKQHNICVIKFSTWYSSSEGVSFRDTSQMYVSDLKFKVSYDV